MDPRPLLDIVNLESPKSLHASRASALKKALGKPQPGANRVVAKYRTRQTKLLGSRNEDPYPYNRSYVFYCLDSPPKE
jgi:hypothetical protein